MPTRNVAIMFTDVKGFTARVSQGKREDLKHLLSVHDKLLAPVFRHFEGTVVKTIGDSFLVRFDSSTEAVLCGVAIQEVLRQYNTHALESERLEIRVAINAGDVELIDGDVMGETVNLAARLEGIAEAGEVYFTESVYLAMNRSEAPSTEIGERTFHGIAYPVRVYKVTHDPYSELARRLARGIRLTDRGPEITGLHEPRIRAGHRGWIWATAAAAVLLAAVSLYVAMRSRPAQTERETRPTESSAQETKPKSTEAPAKQGSIERDSSRTIAEARKQLEHIRQSQGAAAALEWLRERLGRSADLEPLRAQIPILDAIATAETITRGNLEYSEWVPSVVNLLARYPNSSEVPLTLARDLEGKVRPSSYPVELYKIAVDRGANGHDRHILEFCIRQFDSHWPGQVETAHELLRRYFPDEALTWARRAMDEGESGALLENAWTILHERGDERVSDPYCVALRRAIDGYNDQAQSDSDMRVFEQVTDARRQRQVLNLYRWVLAPIEKKGVSSSGYSHKDFAERNLAKLEALWK
jgi:class 3 adenylate cyclase